MTTKSKQQCQGYTHWGCILLRAWVGSQISKNQIYFQLHWSKLWLQFDLRVGLVFPTQRKSIVFLERQLPCWKLLTYLQGSSCHLEGMVSMEKTIPLGYLHMKSFQWYLETRLIFPVSGYLISWVFGSGFIFTGGPIVQFWRRTRHSFRSTVFSLHESSTAIGLWNQEASRLLIT